MISTSRFYSFLRILDLVNFSFEKLFSQDYNCDDARSRRGSETQLHRSEYDQDSVREKKTINIFLKLLFYMRP